MTRRSDKNTLGRDTNQRDRMSPLYLCNPELNTECPKTMCAWYDEAGLRVCRCTRNKKFAHTINGKPVVVKRQKPLPMHIKKRFGIPTGENI